MIRDLLKSLRGKLDETGAALRTVEELRETIEGKRREIEAIEVAPQTMAEAMAAFDAWCDRAAQEAVDALPIRRLLDPVAARAGLTVQPIARSADATPDASPIAQAALGMVFLTCRDTLREVIEGQVADLLGGRDAISADERAARTDRARAELLALELAEEAAIRAMEAAGITIARRGDADPRALLAADASLPAS